MRAIRLFQARRDLGGKRLVTLVLALVGSGMLHPGDAAASTTGRSHDRVEMLLERADQALYRAKNAGRDQVVAEMAS